MIRFHEFQYECYLSIFNVNSLAGCLLLLVWAWQAHTHIWSQAVNVSQSDQLIIHTQFDCRCYLSKSSGRAASAAAVVVVYSIASLPFNIINTE